MTDQKKPRQTEHLPISTRTGKPCVHEWDTPTINGHCEDCEQDGDRERADDRRNADLRGTA